MASKHDETASRIARQRGADYNRGQGPDIKTPNMAIEVETENTVGDAARQLKGFKRPVYVAGATKKATEKALQKYDKSTIGVMDQSWQNHKAIHAAASVAARVAFCPLAKR